MVDKQLQFVFDGVCTPVKTHSAGQPLRLKNGRYATGRQISEEDKRIEIEKIVTEYRQNAAMWQTVRRMSEEIYTLRTQLKLRLCI